MNTTLTTLQSPNIKLGNNYLEITKPLTNEEWNAAFSELIMLNECTNWWLGDFLLAIEASGKDILSTIGDSVGYNYRSLRNMKAVSNKIPKSKRVDGISWTHHREAWIETKNHVAMKSHLELAKINNQDVLTMRKDIRSKASHDDKTIVPDIERTKDGILYREAMNSITAIKRFITNTASKCGETELNLFRKDFYDLVELVDEELS